MENKTIISSKKDRVCRIFIIVGVFFVAATALFYYWANEVSYKTGLPSYDIYGNFMGNIAGQTFSSASKTGYICILLLLIALAVVSFFFYFATTKSEINIEKDKIYGISVFRKRVDLPINAISAIGTSLLKGIAISTSSGVIKFYAIKNNEEIRNIILDLIKDASNADQTVVPHQIIQQSVSEADEIKKYKELLDSGVISQEEFEAKKKQLLGL